MGQILEAKPNLRALTYDFEGAYKWSETGDQIVAASGWRPSYSLHSEINVERTLPPKGVEPQIYREPYGMATGAETEAP